MRTIALISWLLGVAALMAPPALGASVQLAWDPSPSPDVLGYCIYVGTNSGKYSEPIPVGNVTSAVVSNLAVGTTYFFALSAFDAVGLESELSAEIHWVILAPAENLSLQLAVNYQGQPALTATGPAGWRCELLVSTDLRSWSVLTNFTMKPSGTYQFKDSAVLSNEPSARYYRLSTSTAPGLNPR